MNYKSSLVEVHVFRIRNSNMEFLILKRAEGEIYPCIWQMVTGKIEREEKAYETVIREVEEETNLKIEKLWVIPNVNTFYSSEEDAIYNVPVFAAQVADNSDVKLSREHSDYKWVRPDQAEESFAWEGQKKSLRVLVDYYLNKKDYLDMLEITF
ncbi:MAG TPA: NUDIX domain-containing protein [Ignavibacteria bacterium]|nr:NUDIX domain-containing protein [Ignavibacteria bacterium]